MLDAHLDVTLESFRLDATLCLDPGDVVAVLGPNGSGKTTALRLLAGLLALDAGHIELDGTRFDDPEAGVFLPPEHRPVSVVFQDYRLFPHLSVLDNVAFGLRAQGVANGEARRQATTWLERFDLADKAADKPRRLSGGQAQRVALARALAPHPRLLLLDEPLAALDAGTRTTVRRDLRRYLDDFDCATILVTHEPDADNGWEEISQADAIIELLNHTLSTRTRPDDTFDAALAVVRSARTVAGVRGEASTAVPALLGLLRSHEVGVAD